jgi:hypothetical protein
MIVRMIQPLVSDGKCRCGITFLIAKQEAD